MTSPAHDDDLCARSIVGAYGGHACVRGKVYAPCGHPGCEDPCDYDGPCPCACHMTPEKGLR